MISTRLDLYFLASESGNPPVYWWGLSRWLRWMDLPINVAAPNRFASITDASYGQCGIASAGLTGLRSDGPRAMFEELDHPKRSSDIS